MIARLGEAGGGEIWRADDVVLRTVVALRILRSAAPEDRERILHEVRIARQITHPAVCRVFDAGESDGRVFCSMELVGGEDLGTLLRRTGRLPSERVVQIGQQICSGLIAAHAQGILHRDLKPANVLIDSQGLVRVTDFGVATPIGTSAYAAPEQRVAGGALTKRTDVYAVGLILYELMVGRPAFPEPPATPSLPPSPSTLVADVDRQLERAIMQALAPSPERRPASAAALLTLLDASPVTPGRRRGRWMAAAAAVALAIVIVIAFASYHTRPVLTNRDTLVLADFQNTTGEPVFDGALKVALAVGLEQSPFLQVFPDERVRETLRLMERQPNEPITRVVARDIALREQLKALVAGSIAKLGSQYVLAVEAVNANTGDVIAREQMEAPSKEQVLTSLGTALSRFREKLGESLASVNRFDVSLARATTPSLEALHAYSLALDQGRAVPTRVEAIPHLLRAIELDPNFALAQALLSGVYSNTGRSEDAPAYSRRAFELRDRVSERERFFISWRYYMDAAQGWDKGLELAQLWTTTYPREAFAFNSLGLATGAFGQHERAAAAFRHALELDPRFVPSYGNLAGSLIALGRFDEATAFLEQADARKIEAEALRRSAYFLAVIKNDQAAMARAIERARSTTAVSSTSIWQARAAMLQGRFHDAHDWFARAVQLATGQASREVAAQSTVEDAEAHAIAGDCAAAKREAAEGITISRDVFTLQRAARSLALCGDGAGATALVTELTKRFPEATLTARIQAPVVAAATAIAAGQARRALQVLEPVAPYDHAPSAELWPAYLRGQAYLNTNDPRAAREQFQAIVNRRGEAPMSPLYPLAYLGVGRAAARDGDVAGAKAAYERLFALWEHADQDLPSLDQARREYAELRPSTEARVAPSVVEGR
jgi:tetratricopeptide (TPR) repeat protein